MRVGRVLLVSAAGCALATATLAWGQESVNRARQAQQLMQEHKISLADAVQTVERECNGRVVSAHVRVIGAPDQRARSDQGADTSAPNQAGGQLQFIVTCFDGTALRTLLVDQEGQTRPAPDDLQRETHTRERDMTMREQREGHSRDFRDDDAERTGA